MISNRFQLVPREIVSGHIEGVDFGPSLYCIARSPKAVLVWASGHKYTSGRQSVYGESSLIALPDRTRRFIIHPKWRQLGPDGGRLTVDRVLDVSADIVDLFDGESTAFVLDAVSSRQTLLIEGGGLPLCPARNLGLDVYEAWRHLPARGFVQ